MHRTILQTPILYGYKKRHGLVNSENYQGVELMDFIKDPIPFLPIIGALVIYNIVV